MEDSAEKALMGSVSDNYDYGASRPWNVPGSSASKDGVDKSSQVEVCVRKQKRFNIRIKEKKECLIPPAPKIVRRRPPQSPPKRTRRDTFKASDLDKLLVKPKSDLCPTCNLDLKTLKYVTNRLRHIRECGEKGVYWCKLCFSCYSLERNLKTHKSKCPKRVAET